MPTAVPVPGKVSGDVFTATMWNSSIRDNINKLLSTGHRVLTVAQFGALTALEDGDEVYLEVDATNGIIWHLRYVAAEPTYKWRFLGGPELASEVATAEATASTSYVALATAGPSVALPRAGDYDVSTQHEAPGSGAIDAFMSYDVGGTGAVDTDGHRAVWGSYGRTKRRTGQAVVTLTSKYRAVTGTPSFGKRRLAATPVRII